MSLRDYDHVGTRAVVVYGGHHHQDAVGMRGVIEVWEVDPYLGQHAKIRLDDGQIIWTSEAHCVCVKDADDFDLETELRKMQAGFEHKRRAEANLVHAIEKIEGLSRPHVCAVEE